MAFVIPKKEGIGDGRISRVDLFFPSLFFLYRFFLIYLLGNEGMAYFLLPFWFFLSFYFLLAVLPRILVVWQGNFFERGKRGGLSLSVCQLGVFFLAPVLFFLLRFVLLSLYGLRMGTFPLIPLTLSALVLGCQGVLSGRLCLLGHSGLVFVGDGIRGLIGLPLAVVLTLMCRGYGQKMDALFLTETCQYAYAVTGGLFGFFIACLFSLFYYVCSYLLLQRRGRSIGSEEEQEADFRGRRGGEAKKIYGLCLLFCLLFLLLLCVESSVYAVRLLHRDPLSKPALSLGLFFGRGMTPVELFCFFFFFFLPKPVGRLADIIRKGRIRRAGAFYESCLRAILSLSLFLSMAGLSLSPVLIRLVYSLVGDSALLLLARTGSFLYPFLFLSVFHIIFFFRIKKFLLLVFNLSLAFLINVIVYGILIWGLGLGLHSILLGLLSASIVFSGLSLFESFLLLRLFQKKGRLPFLGKVLSALLTGLIVFFLSNLLLYLVGELLTCLLCLFFGVGLYLFFQRIFGGFREEELSLFPLGKRFSSLLLKGKRKDNVLKERKGGRM